MEQTVDVVRHVLQAIQTKKLGHKQPQTPLRRRKAVVRYVRLQEQVYGAN